MTTTSGDSGSDVEDAPGDPETVARIICLRLLGQRACTRAELATALAKRGVPDEDACTVLDRFSAVGLIDDAAFATTFATARHASGGLGRRAIWAQLHRRGVDEVTIERALSGIDADSELETARALVETRLPRMAGLEPMVAARRLTAMLARKGYSAEIAANAVRQALVMAADAETLGPDRDDP